MTQLETVSSDVNRPDGRPLARPNWVEIDADAMLHNVRKIRSLLRPGAKLFATLKANAYGFGLSGVATILADVVDGISIADLEDAIFLRKKGIDVPILLYAGCLTNETIVRVVGAYRLMPTLHDRTSASAFASCPDNAVSAFIKLDVGLERFGIPAEDAVAFVSWLKEFQHITIAGVYTHLHVPKANADITDYLRWQINRFRTALKAIEKAGINVPIAMAESSAVLQSISGIHLDAADPGQMLFGQDTGAPQIVRHDTQSVFKAIKSRLIQVRPSMRPDYLNLAPYRLRDGMRVGIIPFGLRDRINSLSCDAVLVGGQRMPILATPSLEHTRIDLTTLPDAKVGDEVVIIGKQRGNAISVEEVTNYRGHSREADLTISIPDSFPRVYLSGGKTVASL